MDQKRIIGIMGPGEGATTSDKKVAFELGQKLAESNYLVLTGGRASGVMESAMKGAKSAGGITIGILPSEGGSNQSTYVDISIKTGLGSARNNINVLTSDVIIGIGIGSGTTSEIALTIKNQKPVILLNQPQDSISFFKSFDYNHLYIADSVKDSIAYLKAIMEKIS